MKRRAKVIAGIESGHVADSRRLGAYTLPMQTSNAAPCVTPPRRLANNPNGDPEQPPNPPGVKNTDSCLPLRRSGPVEHDYKCDGPAAGDIALRWISGSVTAARNTDPRIQVIAYNEDTYILRENPCVHWEAPFTYLLFGNSGVLLIDTGATPEAEFYPLRKSVDALTVVLTSGEDVSQHQGRGQFLDWPETTLAPMEFSAAKQFYKLASFAGSAEAVEREPRGEVGHGRTRGHDVRPGQGLSAIQEPPAV